MLPNVQISINVTSKDYYTYHKVHKYMSKYDLMHKLKLNKRYLDTKFSRNTNKYEYFVKYYVLLPRNTEANKRLY